MSDSQYDELSTHRQFFRLLRLKVCSVSGKSSTSISGTLTSIAIEDAPSYIALSYTWGPAIQTGAKAGSADTNNSVSIEINNVEISIGRNLYDALIHIQRRLATHQTSQQPLLWIDAICINQQNLSERASQVGMMDQIYGKAAKVWIWLGLPGRLQMQNIVLLTKRLAHAAPELRHGGQVVHDLTLQHDWDALTDQERVLTSNHVPHITSQDWIDFAELLGRRWWSRIWVVQEVALAVEADVLCGDHIIPWHELRKCAAFMSAGLGVQLGHKLRQRDSAAPFEVGAGLVSLDIICRLASSEYADNPIGEIFNCHLVGRPRIQSPAEVLSRLLDLCQGWQASDPRDLAFGLFGLTKKICRDSHIDWQNFMTVSYESTYSDIIVALTQLIVEQTQWLGYLTLLGDIDSRIKNSIPTWAPDPSAGAPPPIMGVTPMIKHSMPALRGSRTVKKTPAIPRFYGKTLRVRGTRLGIITKFSEPLNSFRSGRTTFESAAKLVCHAPEVYPFTLDRRENAFWMTLVGGESRDDSMKHSFAEFWTQSLVDLGRQSEDYLHSIPHVDELGQSDVSQLFPTRQKVKRVLEAPETGPSTEQLQNSGLFKSLFRQISQDRTFFMTDMYHMGIGHCALRPNDEIWVLTHSPCPFILRKAENGCEDFQMVGPAYVHGFYEGVLPSIEGDGQDIDLI